MKLLVVLVSLLLVVFGRDIMTGKKERSRRQETELTAVEKIQRDLQILNHQLMMTKLAMEERVRSEGGSGLKQIRVNNGGTRPYHTSHYGGAVSVAAIHSHANNIRTVGMGEINAVMNGVEFTTRHNDYRLVQPHTSSAGYHDVQDIEFPDVPPEVTSKETVGEQIAEMKLWFKAFAEQNHKERDYRKYFKPVSTYLEGSWTFVNKTIEEGFQSDFHKIDAGTWDDLQQKVKFTSATGRKDRPENFAHLPRKFVDIGNGTEKLEAQWNYRILCHPLKMDLPLVKLRPVDDLMSRFAQYSAYEAYLNSRTVRFQLTDYPPTTDAAGFNSAIDAMMEEIPGPDNYQGNIIDDAFSETAYRLDTTEDEPINAAFYNRYYRDAGSLDQTNFDLRWATYHRAFSDPNLFVALTTQEKVPPVRVTDCKKLTETQVCTTFIQRPVYSIPLEIIYLTPLNKWNPYKLRYKGDASSENGQTVEAKNQNGISRNGSLSPDLAYDGTNSNRYYVTPSEFFSSGEVAVEDADTTKDMVGVLDEKGEVRSVKASGIRVHLPEIEGVGIVRQRYPIMPIYAEGSTTWKQAAALEDALMQMENYLHLYKYMPPVEDRVTKYGRNTIYTFYMPLSKSTEIEPHYHQFNVTVADLEYLTSSSGKKTKRLDITTSVGAGHVHKIKFGWNKRRQIWAYLRCDGEAKCKDMHPKMLTYARQ